MLGSNFALHLQCFVGPNGVFDVLGKLACVVGEETLAVASHSPYELQAQYFGVILCGNAQYGLAAFAVNRHY